MPNEKNTNANADDGGACKRKPPHGSKTSSHTSPSHGGRAGSKGSRLVPLSMGPDESTSMGPGEISYPRSGRKAGGRLRASPQQTDRCWRSGRTARWGSLVFGWRALRPPRVVFVLGFVSLFAHFTPKKTDCTASCSLTLLKIIRGRARMRRMYLGGGTVPGRARALGALGIKGLRTRSLRYRSAAN